ncbi:MAG: efflux RND transporter periplasmic adaptor subunit [Tepidanaerobacter acetatoxydans]|jgi:HlyD family secretion protein|uniref:efflux RND transporter periplasmic adaptor subunit n=1 Tax=Tepidanaerobacter TaxID=499228 RepID=UPI000A64822D|nr:MULTISPECIES: efflux RND transporter periplasmic adaptor subunit [Tepidanaerobacter]NLU10293.1 efflux RND transporter periplasmic adaptor subunit [Tepidanaerobacter acetatoxydans]
MNIQRKKLISVIIVLTFIVASIALTGCKTKKYGDISEEAAVPVEVKEVKLNSIKDITKLTGTIEAEDDVKVTSKIPGRVEQVLKDVGDFVEKGEPLVILETKELQNQLAQAEAALAMAQANLSANEDAALPQQLEQVRASLEQAEANYVNAKADYERMKALYEAEAISKQVFDGMTLKYQVAKTQYETAKEQYRLTKERLPKNIEALRAQVKQAQSAVDLIKTNLENSIITSPVTGIISNKLINNGEVISAGYPLLTVVNIDTVKVVIDVAEEEINKIKDGQEVDVTIGAIGGEKIKGIISIVPPASNATRLFQVKISIDNKDHTLKPGMFAEVDVEKGIKENVVVLPKDAILLKKHGNVVFVVSEGKAVERIVKLGITNGNSVEILEGVNPGEKVVVKGQNMLKEGVSVKL